MLLDASGIRRELTVFPGGPVKGTKIGQIDSSAGEVFADHNLYGKDAKKLKFCVFWHDFLVYRYRFFQCNILSILPLDA